MQTVFLLHIEGDAHTLNNLLVDRASAGVECTTVSAHPSARESGVRVFASDDDPIEVLKAFKRGITSLKEDLGTIKRDLVDLLEGLPNDARPDILDQVPLPRVRLSFP